MKNRIKEIKVTPFELFRIENEYGVNLYAGDGREDWMEAAQKLQTFISTKYRPFLKVIEKVTNPAPQQLEKKSKLEKEYIVLHQMNEFRRFQYYVQLLSYFIDEDLTNSEDVTAKMVETFAEHYEKKMRQYFIIPSDEEAYEDDGDMGK